MNLDAASLLVIENSATLLEQLTYLIITQAAFAGSHQ